VGEELLLVLDGVDGPLLDDPSLHHLLHGVELLLLHLLHLPDLAEPAPPDHVQELETRLRDRFTGLKGKRVPATLSAFSNSFLMRQLPIINFKQ